MGLNNERQANNENYSGNYTTLFTIKIIFA